MGFGEREIYVLAKGYFFAKELILDDQARKTRNEEKNRGIVDFISISLKICRNE